jgi:uncharacterized protein (DUF488 family)
MTPAHRKCNLLAAGNGALDAPCSKTLNVMAPPFAIKFVTIGVYGFSEQSFFQKLQDAGVNTFCDIRWRRGVRGHEYAFANRARLEKRLREMGIRYLHFRELAPSPELRQRQAAADELAGIAKRKRAVLGQAFVAGYQEAMSHFQSRKFVESLGGKTKVAALFCVERDPAACHRSLLTERLLKDLPGLQVVHLLPDS